MVLMGMSAACLTKMKLAHVCLSVEIGYINCRAVQTAIHHADEVDIEEIDVPAGDTRNIRRGSTSGSRHIIEYCKITGDINVPR